MVDYTPSFSLPWLFYGPPNMPKDSGTSFTHVWYHFGKLIASRSLKIAPLLMSFDKATLRMLITIVFFFSSGTYSLFKGTLSTVALRTYRQICKPRI